MVAEVPTDPTGISESSPPQGSAATVVPQSTGNSEMASAVRMAGAVRKLLLEAGGSASTAVVVSTFQSATSQAEAIMLRAVLQNVASFSDGLWTLKAEYR